MKPFSFEEYLANPERRVVTRAGNKVEIINTNGRKQFPIIGYVDNNPLATSWCGDGRFLEDKERTNPFDLFFADEESEDERIRKETVSIVKQYGRICEKEGDFCPSINDCLAWLEKQKEQKPAELNTRDKIISRATSEKQVVLLSESNGSAEIGWDTRSLEDAKNLLEYGLAFINREIEKIAGLGSGPDYATTEGRYNHLFKQQEQPKWEWSKEDELMTKSCLRALQFFRDFGKGECNIQWRPNYFDLGKIVYPEQVEDWLKSLRQRPHWKPSEKQMKKFFLL